MQTNTNLHCRPVWRTSWASFSVLGSYDLRIVHRSLPVECLLRQPHIYNLCRRGTSARMQNSHGTGGLSSLIRPSIFCIDPSNDIGNTFENCWICIFTRRFWVLHRLGQLSRVLNITFNKTYIIALVEQFSLVSCVGVWGALHIYIHVHVHWYTGRLMGVCIYN